MVWVGLGGYYSVLIHLTKGFLNKPGIYVSLHKFVHVCTGANRGQSIASSRARVTGSCVQLSVVLGTKLRSFVRALCAF